MTLEIRDSFSARPRRLRKRRRPDGVCSSPRLDLSDALINGLPLGLQRRYPLEDLARNPGIAHVELLRVRIKKCVDEPKNPVSHGLINFGHLTKVREHACRR